MTGIVGVIARDRGLSAAQAEVEALAGTYEALRGTGLRHAAAAGSSAQIIKIDTASASRPGIERHHGSWAAATGVVHGAPSLIGTALAELDGQFGLISYDRDADSITVATDPLGMHTLYAAERAGKTYISSSALVLARHLGAPPSRLGLAVLLCCGTQYGPITNWEGIERLGPATCLRFDAAGMHRSTYWRLEVDEAVARLGFGQAVDHAIEVLSATFGHYFAGQVGMWADLTGGYDTRLLTLLLHRAGCPSTPTRSARPERPTSATGAGWPGWRAGTGRTSACQRTGGRSPPGWCRPP